LKQVSDGVRDLEPVWSPDGKEIAFYGEDRYGNSGIFLTEYATAPKLPARRVLALPLGSSYLDLDWQPRPLLAGSSLRGYELTVASVRSSLLAKRAPLATTQARRALDQAVATTDAALQAYRWGADGSPRLNQDGLELLGVLRVAVARLTWANPDLTRAAEQERGDLIAAVHDIAHERFMQAFTFVGEGGAPDRFALWRAERHLRDADNDANRVHATLRYISAWQALLGQPPCC
jgi:hypothetical protein